MSLGDRDPLEPGVYRHFTGGLYRVVAVGHNVVGDGTNEVPEGEVVVYHALFTSEQFGENHWWVRSVKNFQDLVDSNGVSRPRFQRVAD